MLCYVFVQIALGRNSGALKLWFTMRAYGLDKLRAFVRNRTKLGELLEALINQDDRYVISLPSSLAGAFIALAVLVPDMVTSRWTPCL